MNKLTQAQVDELRAEYADSGEYFGKQSELARKYGISGAAVHRIVRGKSWTGLPPERRQPIPQSGAMMSTDEIATHLGVSRQCVESLLASAFRKIRAQLTREQVAEWLGLERWSA